VLEEVRVQRQDGELVQTDKTRDKLQNQQLGLELQLRLCVLDVLGEEVLSEALRVVQEV